jgi:hypothetical protein
MVFLAISFLFFPPVLSLPTPPLSIWIFMKKKWFFYVGYVTACHCELLEHKGVWKTKYLSSKWYEFVQGQTAGQR